MFAVPVDVFQKRRQFLGEQVVVLGATEAAGVAELDERQPAMRALPLVQGRDFLVLLSPDLARFLRLRLIQILVGTLLAQVVLFALLLAEDFRDMQRGLLRTLFALHRSASRSAAAAAPISILTGGIGVSTYKAASGLARYHTPHERSKDYRLDRRDSRAR